MHACMPTHKTRSCDAIVTQPTQAAANTDGCGSRLLARRLVASERGRARARRGRGAHGTARQELAEVRARLTNWQRSWFAAQAGECERCGRVQYHDDVVECEVCCITLCRDRCMTQHNDEKHDGLAPMEQVRCAGCSRVLARQEAEGEVYCSEGACKKGGEWDLPHFCPKDADGHPSVCYSLHMSASH